jgi:predicted DsbA family dithiol-disulfide isomerase
MECAEEEGKKQEMYEALHVTTETLSQREVDLIGQELGLPVIAFRACLKSDKYGAKIGEAIAYAEEKGITRKPTILIGDTILYGNQPIENIERVIDKILNP